MAARLLETTRAHLEAVLRQMPSGVIIAEAPGGRLILCNEQAERIWRRPLPLLVGTEAYAAWEGYHLDGRRYRPEEWPLSRSILAGDVVRDERIRIRRGDGTWGWISASSAPVGDDGGHVAGGVMVFSDVTEQVRAEALLERYRVLFERARDVILFIDPEDGRILEANEAALRTYGYSRDEILSLTIYDLRAPETRQLVPAQMAEAAAHGILFATTHRRKDGSTFPAEVSSQWAPWDGRPALLSIIRDVTERQRVEAERQRLLEAEHRARQEAEAALRLREEFLSVAAHELRTPLTSLKGYAELTMHRIEEGRLQDPQQMRRALQVIDRQSDRLSTLVSQLLDISRIEAGELELDRRVTDLVPLARSMVETMQTGTTRHTLSLHAPPSLEATVDPLRLEEVLYNLIDNAIRYSPKGGPVEVELSTPAADTVRVAVRDYGIGVPPEQRERLFTRFFQAARRPAGGLGLGLYISRRIVELHGGRIWAEFPEDGGSRFVVSLPRGEHSTVAPPAPTRTAERG